MKADLERIALGANPDAVVITAPTGEVVYWSDGAQATFGHAASDALGQPLRLLVVPENEHGQFRNQVAALFDQGSAVFEALCRKHDGTLIQTDVSCRSVGAVEKQIDYLVFTYKDVTTLRAARAARTVAPAYAQLIEAIPDGALLVNAAQRIVLANTCAESMFGYARGALRGMAIESLLPSRLRGEHTAALANCFGTACAVKQMELYGQRSNGSELPLELSIGPLHGDDGMLSFCVVRNASERKRIEIVLANKNAELQVASEAKNRFLATMSHELRTPLNAIIGFTGTLLMQLPGPLNTAQQKQLATIKGSANRLLALINDVLDVTRIESGNVDLKMEPVSCAAVVTSVAATAREYAQLKGLTFELHMPDEDVLLRSDQRALTQIVTNLVNNAIKFTEHGGVTLTLERRHEAAGPLTSIRVQDTGCGIEQPDLTRLFKPFEQIDSSLARKFEGTGLGLYLSQKLADSIGARIACSSEFGKGSTFELQLRGV